MSNHTRFFRLALQEAQKSVAEDNRPRPKVGVVVVKNGAILARAHRGEINPGEHAEFTVLERKLGTDLLTGATVYTTLEPCTTRNHPKVPCARRLIERRVRAVYIGNLDPDPRITGRGERMLVDAGIEVGRFTPVYMRRLEEINRVFTASIANCSEMAIADGRPSSTSVRPKEKRPEKHTPHRLVLDEDSIHVLSELGVAAAVSRLADSSYEPIECMRRARHTLQFLGIVGSKWVSEVAVRAEFAQFLGRIRQSGGQVSFLLMNPSSEGFRHLRNQRGGAVSAESLKHFRRLRAEFPCLRVHLYGNAPCFRLVFLDHLQLAVSRYKVDRDGYCQSKYGWDAPHLVLTPEAPWSLYYPFEAYYAALWRSASPLE